MTLPWQTIINSEKQLSGKFCVEPWKSITLIENGDVTTCQCYDWTSVTIGNVLKTPLEEIYASSERLHDIRTSVIDGKYNWCKVGHCSLLNNLPDASDNPWLKFQIPQKPKLPSLIRLGIDPVCNLKCFSCRPKLMYTTKENQKATRILESLVNSYKNHDQITEVIGDGTGDIFTSKSYENILWGGKIPECWRIGFLTNGNLITKRKNQLKIIKHNISTNFGFQVSLDAATPEVYKKVRGGDFQIVLDGLEVLKDLGILFHLEFVLQADNYRDLEKYHEIGKKYNVFHGVQHIDQRGHMGKEGWDAVKLENNPNIDYKYLKQALQLFVDDPNCNIDGGVQELLKEIDTYAIAI
jgi:MoaA/NifB/PqqE/SkfB family radical SAM enzyme